MEVPRLVVQLELQLPAYTTAIAMQDPSHIFNLHHSSQQHRILTPLREARDWICILMDTCQVHNLLSHNRNSHVTLISIITTNVGIMYLHTHTHAHSTLSATWAGHSAGCLSISHVNDGPACADAPMDQATLLVLFHHRAGSRKRKLGRWGR